MPRRNSAALKTRTRERHSLKGKTTTVWDSTGSAHSATVLHDHKRYLILRMDDGSKTWAAKPYA